MPIELTQQQGEAVKKIQNWMEWDTFCQPVFRLFGYAGTGKTTIATEIASLLGGRVVFGAFTGKAAQVMRNKGCSNAMTIHLMIYHPVADSRGNVKFERKRRGESEVCGADLIIIDECSMVNEVLATDLMSFGVPILVIGDPAQLPPVTGTGFFTNAEPDALLTEIHRQALDNPIIAMSMKVRLGEELKVGSYGDSKVISGKQFTREDALGADQIIVGKNVTRVKTNTRMRQLLLNGSYRPLPVAGEKLVCLRNDRKIGILNGSMWGTTGVDLDTGRRDFIEVSVDSLDGEDRHLTSYAASHFFLGKECDLTYEQRKGTADFTYGYALTAHKAQGSQWDDVLLFDESHCFRENSRQWLYTALTRAAQRVTIVAA